MSAHTPFVLKYDRDAHGAILSDPNATFVPDSLIAAAPEMYRALEMNECLHPADGSYCDPNVGPCAARAAIAKAKGESK